MKGKERFDHQNEYNRQKYDRVGLMLPKGTADVWKSYATSQGISLNSFIQKAVVGYINELTDKKTPQ